MGSCQMTSLGKIIVACAALSVAIATTDSAAELSGARAENARLRVEITELRQQLARAELKNDDAMFDLEAELLTETSDESSFGKARKAAKKAAKKAANAAKKAMPLKGSEKGLPKGIVKTGKKELSIIIQPKPLKTRDYKQTLDQVKSLKYKGSPAWRLAAHGLGKFVGNHKKSAKPVIRCPCSEKGRKLTREDALRRILASIDILGISNKICEKPKDRPAYIRSVSLGAVKLFKCWQVKCKVTTDEEIDLQWGGGAACQSLQIRM